MYYLQVHIVILLCGLCHIYGLTENVAYPLIYPFGQSDSFEQVSDLTGWIEQPVDHFNQSDQRTWKQKYNKITDYWKPGGPILIFINGEIVVYSQMDKKKFWYQIAEQTNAVVYEVVVRYYKENQPFDTRTPENFVYLTSRQILADIANLLHTVKKSEEFTNSKVIVVGGSYGGNVAAWMKVVHPNLVDAVLASSAPVLAKIDFQEFAVSVTDSYRKYGSQECVDKISKIFSTYVELLKTPEGIEEFKKEFHICKSDNLTIPENQQNWLLGTMIRFANYAVYRGSNGIAMKCREIISGQHDVTLRSNPQGFCYTNRFDELPYWLYQPGFKNMLSWIYQMCTEFGHFINTNSTTMFRINIPLDFHYKLCKLLFGEKFNEERLERGVIDTNKMYGGLTPNVKNVVFVYGETDVYSKLGIPQDLSPDAPVIYINGTGHCSDLQGDSPSDNDSLKEARKRIIKLLKQWIEPK